MAGRLYWMFLRAKLAGVKSGITAVPILLALTLGASGCEYFGIGESAKGKDAVRQHLVNPNSATFRNVYVANSDGVKTVCGEVNSRNREGDFIGYQRFYSRGGAENTFLENTSFEFSVNWDKYCE